MKFNTLCAFLLLHAITSFSQTVKGVIKDQQGRPLEYVSVKLTDSISPSILQSSNPSGEVFFEKLRQGTKYSIFFSLVGYKPYTIKLKMNQDTLLQVILEEQKTTLKAVDVVAKKKIFERKVDRFVFNVEGNVNLVGNDVMGVLSLTPLVRVEDNSISLTGKGEVAIMVDDRIINLTGEALTAYLRSINVESITAVEVITNPPSQYEARGNSGLINIVTKKNRILGFNGILNSSLSKSTYYNGMLGANLNYNFKNKFLIFTNFSGALGANAPYLGKDIFYSDQTWNSSQFSKDKTKFIRGSIGMEYMISKNTSLALSYNQLASHPNRGQTENVNIINKSTNSLDSILNAFTNTEKNYSSRNGNLHFSHNFAEKKRELVLDLDYFGKDDLSNLNFQNTTLLPYSETLISSNSYLTRLKISGEGLSANALYKIAYKNGKLQFGGKASFVESKNQGGFFIYINGDLSELGGDFQNNFSYKENIQALFGNYSLNVGKFEFQIGLRGEFTQYKAADKIDQNNFSNQYFSLFPTFYTSWNLSEKHNLSFSYGRRISRPNYSSLNPTRVYQGLYSVAQGNPDLKPSYANNLELSHTYDNFLTSMISVSISNNAMSAIELVSDGSREQSFILGNFLSTKNFVWNEVAEFKISKWWQLINELSAYYVYSKTNVETILPTTKGFGAVFRTVNNLTLNKAKTFTGGATFNYQFKDVSGIYTNKRYYNLDLTLSRVFYDKRLQLSFQARDVFKTKNLESYYLVNNILNSTFSNGDSRRFVFSIRYNFGSNKLKSGKAYSAGGEEQNRQ